MGKKEERDGERKGCVETLLYSSGGGAGLEREQNNNGGIYIYRPAGENIIGLP